MRSNKGFLFHPSPAPEGAAIVAGVETIDTHATGTAAGGMYELAVAGVDADMGDAAGHSVEEDEITGLQVAAGYAVALMKLLFRGVWERNPFAAIDEACESGTVEGAAAGRSVAVGRAAIGDRRADHTAVSAAAIVITGSDMARVMFGRVMLRMGELNSVMLARMLRQRRQVLGMRPMFRGCNRFGMLRLFVMHGDFGNRNVAGFVFHEVVPHPSGVSIFRGDVRPSVFDGGDDELFAFPGRAFPIERFAGSDAQADVVAACVRNFMMAGGSIDFSDLGGRSLVGRGLMGLRFVSRYPGRRRFESRIGNDEFVPIRNAVDVDAGIRRSDRTYGDVEFAGDGRDRFSGFEFVNLGGRSLAPGGRCQKRGSGR